MTKLKIFKDFCFRIPKESQPALPPKAVKAWKKERSQIAPEAQQSKINALIDDQERHLAEKACMQKFTNLQIAKPTPPLKYSKYLSFSQDYMLHDKPESRLSIPWIQHTGQLSEKLRALYTSHENKRYEMRIQHKVERERLILSCEAETMRLNSKAERSKISQKLPKSACSYLLMKDEHLTNHYTMPSHAILEKSFKNTLEVIQYQEDQKNAEQSLKPVRNDSENGPMTRKTASSMPVPSLVVSIEKF